MNPINLIFSAVDSIATLIRSGIQTELTNIERNFTNTVVTPIASFVNQALDVVGSGISRVATTASSALGGVINAVSDKVSSMASTVVSTLGLIIDNVSNGLREVGNVVGTTIKTTITNIGNVLSELEKGIGSALGVVGKDIGIAFNSVIEFATKDIFPVIKDIGKFLGELPQDLLAFGKEIVGGIESVGKDVGDLVSIFRKRHNLPERIASIADIPTDLARTLTSVAGELVTPPLKILLTAAGFNANIVSPDTFLRIIETAAAEAGIGAVEEFTPGIAFIMSNLIKSISDPLLAGAYRELEYAGNITQPNRLLPMQTALDAFFRGISTRDQLNEELLKEGFDTEITQKIVETSYTLLDNAQLVELRYRGVIADDKEFVRRALANGTHPKDAEALMLLMRPLLNVNTAVEMWRRNIKPEGFEDFFDDMRRAGWTEERIKALKDTSHVLPNIFNIQDFVVREVDNQAIVDKFQLDHGINEEYFADASKLGYDRKTAQRFYRYYWEYPSLFLIRALYEQNRISADDFRALLKFSRYTPYWIEKLTTGLAPKLTATDIEKMYRYQVFKAVDIVPQLMKIGMTQELAEQHKKLWLASVKLASPLDQTAAQIQQQNIKGLTLSLILDAYKDHVASRAEALAYLKEIGETKETSELHMRIADYNIHTQIVKERVALLKEELSANQITIQDAALELTKLEITADQIDLYSAEFLKLTTHKPKIPSLAEMQSWFKKGIISIQQLSSGLSMLGYANVWIPYYLKAAGASDDMINEISLTQSTVL